jgi:REP element-mobilizing transposase RayT
MDLFQGKYRNESLRLKNWDYGSNAWYFVTIATKNQEPYFGNIKNNEMQHTEIGQIAEKYWCEISIHFPFVILDEFIIMPDHLHGIIIINKNDDDCCHYNNVYVGSQDFANLPDRQKINNTINGNTINYKNKFGPQSKNLASIIRGFKTGVKKYATMTNSDFIWQRGYYEHIIRDEQSLSRIRKYIRNNPMKWGLGKITEI